MELKSRYYLKVPKSTILLTFFALFNLIALSIYLWLSAAAIPQYLFFILSFTGFYIGFSIFKIIWWNVFSRGWLKITSEKISFMKYFSATTINIEDILDINIPGLDDSAPLSDCINISAIASHLQQTTFQIIIPMVFFPLEDQELLPLLLSSVTK